MELDWGRRPHAVWLGACAVALAAGAVHPVVLEVAVLVIGAAAPVLIVRRSLRAGAREHGVWLLLAATMVCLWLAWTLTLGFTWANGRSPGYPSAVEAFNVAAYVVAFVALVHMIRRRASSGDPTSLIDALIVSGGLGVLVWVFVMVPYVQDGQVTPVTRATDVLFSALSLAVIAAVARLAIGPGARNPSYYLLGLSGLSALASELTLSLSSASATDGTFDPANLVCSALVFVFATASVLHPGAGSLLERSAEPIGRMSKARAGVMSAAVLACPVALVLSTGEQSTIHLIGLEAGWVFLSVLVMLRVIGLVRARERSVASERILGEAAAELVATTDRATMEAVGERAMRALFDDAATVSVHVARLDGEHLVTGEASGPLTLDLAKVSATVRADLHAGHPAWAGRPDGRDGGEILVVPMLTQARMRGALLVLGAGRVDPSLLGALIALARTLSLGLESLVSIAEHERRESEQRFSSFIERSSDIVVVHDANGQPVFVSPAAHRLVPDHDDGFDLLDLVHPSDHDTMVELLSGTRAPNANERLELRLRDSEGRWRWFEVTATDLGETADGNALVITARDISDRKVAESRLAASEARFRSLVQHSGDVVAIIDRDGIVRYVSPSVDRLLGWTADAITERSIFEVLDENDVAHLTRALAGLRGATPTKTELRLRRRQGGWRSVEVTLTDLSDEPSVAGVVLNAHDVTEQKLLQESLRHQAHHDELTGLVNRVGFRKSVVRALEAVQAEDRGVAVLFIDLDDFKTINDGLGHAIGDEVLEAAAHRLRGCLRTADLAARLGGDEFAVLLFELVDEHAALEVARRILDELTRPVLIGGRELAIAATVGLAFSRPGSTAEEMLRNADAAMYYGKSRGKSRIEIFDQSMHVSAFERLELKVDLEGAVERDEMLLHYQPIIELATSRIIGFEALIRWRHPTRGMVSPASFIPLAEETGKILHVGRWALCEALGQLRDWNRCRRPGDGLTMNVNLSARQLDDEDLVAEVAAALEASGVEPHYLSLELTESRAVTSPDAASRLELLRALGIGIAIDDFGAGQASYASLQRHPHTNVKIDRSIVGGLGTAADARARAQIESILTMAHATGVKVTAEGVEHGEQVATLRAIGCDLAQGFFFHRPLPPAEAGQLLGLAGKASATNQGSHA